MNKTLLLLGAGAAKPFGGKLTDELTKHIVEKSTIKAKDGSKFVEKLLERLKYVDEYNNTNEIQNFELVLGILEMIYSYLFDKDNRKDDYEDTTKKHFLNFMDPWPRFFNIDEEILNSIPDLIISEEYQQYYYYQNNENNQNLYVYDNTPERKHIDRLKNFVFIEGVATEIITIIKKHVDCYSKNVDSKNEFFEYLKYLKTNGNSLRIYSLNYDCLPYEYFDKEQESSSYTNGFKKNNPERQKSYSPIGDLKLEDPEPDLELDLKTILSNTNSDCFYSLHGNILLQSNNFSKTNNKGTHFNYPKFSNHFFKLNRLPDDSIYMGDSLSKQDKEEYIDFGIISGFNKIKRINNQPYRAYFHAFQKDVLEVNKIIIIGYSFSDYHVNEILRDMIECRYNDGDLTIEIITKADKDNDNAHPEVLKKLLKDNSINLNIGNTNFILVSYDNEIGASANKSKSSGENFNLIIRYNGFEPILDNFSQ